MKIFINGEVKEIVEPVNLIELLKLLALPQERIAIELNRQVVRKKDWKDINVGDGDKLEVIHFVGGG
jgi:thiamine biosynthesis protein ThiS